MSRYQICTRCVMDTTDRQISFDQEGICNHCHDYTLAVTHHPVSPEKMADHFQEIVNRIKDDNRENEYDCVIGLSGGVDSSYLAWVLVTKYALRPLVVHLDNGWNSKIAVQNIQRIVRQLDIDLYTHVIQWEEFRDLQKSYFQASVVDIEVPTDHAITALVNQVAVDNSIQYILLGTNRATERILPKTWSFNKNDLVNIQAIHRKYGTIPLPSYPILGLTKQWKNKLRHGLKFISPLDYLHYDKQEAKSLLQTELKWKDYGGKHHESVFTRFYQGYILPRKFNIDKRRAHFSSLINASQMTREEALEQLRNDTYPQELQQEDYVFVSKKLGCTREEFERILDAPVRSHFDFPTDIWSKINRKYLTPGSSIRKMLVKLYYGRKI